MDRKKEADAVSPDQPDVYERARMALNELIAELCEVLDEDDPEPFKRKGYEMIGHYFRQPVHTGDLTLMVASVLSDILYKLELTQQGEDVTMVGDEYSVMKKEE
ncbi:hypothetical protein [Brevibacillus sp. SAFN-007a]|uniref:hypothetical protein n=1 Tax=Brevibacillus sp. SAFN-007a TaxID=3436862 RepID=UPI003F7E791A